VEPRPLLHRLLAGLALVALIAAGIQCSYVIYSDKADFSAARPSKPAGP
jgi:hypothetical protein